jgi:hypothetical protein
MTLRFFDESGGILLAAQVLPVELIYENGMDSFSFLESILKEGNQFINPLDNAFEQLISKQIAGNIFRDKILAKAVPEIVNNFNYSLACLYSLISDGFPCPYRIDTLNAILLFLSCRSEPEFLMQNLDLFFKHTGKTTEYQILCKMDNEILKLMLLIELFLSQDHVNGVILQNIILLMHYSFSDTVYVDDHDPLLTLISNKINKKSNEIHPISKKIYEFAGFDRVKQRINEHLKNKKSPTSTFDKNLKLWLRLWEVCPKKFT